MCGRFNVSDSPALHSLLEELGIAVSLPAPRFNIAPTEAVFTLFQDGHDYGAKEMRWWLTPSWASEPSQKYAMFNARAESAASSKAFARPLRRQRAIVPASSFIEWQRQEGRKQPFLVAPENHLLLFAAIWEHWQRDEQELFSCAILTCDAVPAFASIHHRQPVMLPRDAVQRWLDPVCDLESLQGLMLPALPGRLRVQPVDTAINNARNKQAPEPAGEATWLENR